MGVATGFINSDKCGSTFNNGGAATTCRGNGVIYAIDRWATNPSMGASLVSSDLPRTSSRRFCWQVRFGYYLPNSFQRAVTTFGRLPSGG